MKDIVNLILIIILIFLSPYLLAILLPCVIYDIGEAIAPSLKMKTLQLFRWLKEPWPLHLFPFFAIIHLLLLCFFEEYSKDLNIWFSTGFQLLGGLIVVWIISLNIGIITKTSLLKDFISYLKRCPLFYRGKNVFLVSGMSSSSSISSPKLTIKRKFKSIEDKVTFLLDEVERLETEILNSKKETDEKIKKAEDRLNKKINSLKKQIEETDSKIKNIFIGGVKWEMLGVINIAYGLLIPLFFSY